MRSRLTVLLLTLSLSASTALATPAHQWSHSYGSANEQYVSSCFPDPFGNIIVYGAFTGNFNITTPWTSPGTLRDLFIAKFAPNGTPLWSNRISFPFADTAWNATSDISGNTIVSGSVGPTDDERSAFIARYTPAGAQQWIKYFASTDSSAYAEVVTTDAQKQIYVAGHFRGSINLGGSTLVSISPDGDMFVGRFDALGNHVWSKKFGTAGFGTAITGIRVGPDGRPTLFGAFDGSINFGGGILTAVTDVDLFLVKFNANDGAHVWSKQFGITGEHFSRWMDVDPSGRIAVTAESWGQISYGGATLNAAGGPDITLAVLNANGEQLWAKVFGAGDREVPWSVAFASNNDVLLTGYMNGTDPFTFGGAPLSGQAIYNDLVVARFFVANGAHRWSTKFSLNGASTYASIEEVNGKLMLAGSINGPNDFGGGPLPYSGGEDAFVALFADHLTAAGPTLARASLAQNSPNPFNPTTRIEYTLASRAAAVIEIFDASGAVVSRLDEGMKPAGTHSTIWNGRDETGGAVASGVYFYRLAGMPDAGARKMVLLK